MEQGKFIEVINQNGESALYMRVDDDTYDASFIYYNELNAVGFCCCTNVVNGSRVCHSLYPVNIDTGERLPANTDSTIRPATREQIERWMSIMKGMFPNVE